ncbi:MAG: V-type ATP synthase subunit E [Candidatus ainarchaeum sp.]|nr:V-type ATP synthase subunit E [Candidatus ainarchaeum sp.]
MGIENLKGSLLSEASGEAQKIVDSAQAHVDAMVEEERSKRAAMKKDAEKEVGKLLMEQRNERIAWARLESKRVIAEAREDAIKGVLEDFFDSMKTVRKSPEYKKFLNARVADALEELGAGATIHVVKGDKALTAVKNAKVVEDLEGLGGALVESADGKFRMNLTLETLFELRRDEVRKEIYEILFGGK